MEDWIRLVGETQALELFGIRLVGLNADNGKKLLFTLVFITALLWLGRLTQRLARRRLRGGAPHVDFWVRQAIKLGTAVLLILGLLSIWFEDPTRLATALGLVTAGLAFALQKVVT
ncbi:hypothetical protein, partial [Methylibium sp.]|uniref:hypothetical protein n=1 Tax=Methylibium sp. TaxID=2067992 RepID=UPI001803355A